MPPMQPIELPFEVAGTLAAIVLAGGTVFVALYGAWLAFYRLLGRLGETFVERRVGGSWLAGGYRQSGGNQGGSGGGPGSGQTYGGGDGGGKK